jgi:hypothetical protein
MVRQAVASWKVAGSNPAGTTDCGVDWSLVPSTVSYAVRRGFKSRLRNCWAAGRRARRRRRKAESGVQLPGGPLTTGPCSNGKTPARHAGDAGSTPAGPLLLRLVRNHKPFSFQYLRQLALVSDPPGKPLRIRFCNRSCRLVSQYVKLAKLTNAGRVRHSRNSAATLAKNLVQFEQELSVRARSATQWGTTSYAAPVVVNSRSGRGE